MGAVPVLVRGVSGEAGDVERVHHRRCGRSSSLAAVLNPVNPSIATTFIPSRHALGRGASHAFERGLGAALDHVEQPGRSGPGQDGVVGGVPRHGQRFSDPGHDQVRTAPTARRGSGQLRTGLSRPARVLTPHVATTATPVAAHGHQQRRRPPPERDMNQPPDDRVPRHPLDSHTDDTSRPDRPPDTPGLPDRVRPAAPRPPVPTRPGV